MKKKYKIILTVVVTMFVLLFILGAWAVVRFVDTFGQGVVNCKTFRQETMGVTRQIIGEEFQTIERDYTCIAGLDSPDHARFIVVNDQSMASGEQLQERISEAFKKQGWESQADGKFSIRLVVEKKDVTYTATIASKQAAPAVIQVDFDSTVDAFTDFMPSKDFPPDIPLAKQNAQKYLPSGW